MHAINDNEIVVVSGLPRSGTSMAMAMLAAGGMPLLVDAQRGADADNPAGYFEYAPVKRLHRDASWLPSARGRAVKIVAPLLKYIPAETACRVVYMRRALGEVLASQRTMLQRSGKEIAGDHTAARAAFEALERATGAWLQAQPNLQCLYLEHADVLREPPRAAAQMTAFLGYGLDTAKMAAAVDVSLYRQRTV
jgi:hypothetical protein